MDNLDLTDRVNRLNIFAVRAYEVADLEFPYFVTGWNFVNSMTTEDPSQGIVIINNSQFKIFLQGFGWQDTRYPFAPLETVEKYLVGESIYRAVMRFLDGLSFDIQPLPTGIGLSLMPLWTRVWWDRKAMEELRKFRIENARQAFGE